MARALSSPRLGSPLDDLSVGLAGLFVSNGSRMQEGRDLRVSCFANVAHGHSLSGWRRSGKELRQVN